MRHTVRRTFQGLEQTVADGLFARQGKAYAAGSGTGPGTAPVRSAPTATHTRHNVPDRGIDSGP
ncbi:hypothetical protein ACFUIW_12725 [Streptomyces sp. NPDC057245]|uniref:hypothetical protein n=1 Tax=Streptomyces sp. NPDC057245 TaxID=3346065 RepID=UPI0036386AA6